MEVLLKQGERTDDLQRNGFRIIQNPELFCFGMDAVLLSGFAKVKKGENCIDLGTGTGIIPILLSAKTEGKHFTGLEIQPEVADMAKRSVLLNDLKDRVEIVDGDICHVLKKASGAVEETAGGNGDAYAGACYEAGSFDVVTSNPPYMKGSHGLTNPEETKAVSRHEVCCTLKDVCRAAAGLLHSNGRFYMVHRPLRLAEIITELKAVNLEPKRMKFVHPYADKEANMVLIEAVKDAGSECRVEKPIIVYREPGKYTEEIYTIYGY